MPGIESLDNYYYKSTDFGGKTYFIVYLKKDEESIEPRGFYDNTTYKIIYEEDLEKQS